MKWLTKDEVRSYLRSNDVSSEKTIEEIIKGFDFDKPIYEQTLEAEQKIYQYVRNASFADLSQRTGNWFCLRGATTSGLAIIGGGSGRRVHKYRVSSALTAIEGLASAQRTNWEWSGGGKGGTTQIYIPPRLLGHINAVGPAESW